MKVILTQDIVRRLRPENKPKGLDGKGKLVFAENVGVKKYILFDASQDAPPGFGVCVYPGKKTYVLQRRVGAKVVKATIGNCADMPIQEARERAGKMALEIKETRVNPNVTARGKAALTDSMTLGQILSSHRAHLVGRTQRPAMPATLHVIDRSYRKFKSYGWVDRPLLSITVDEIMTRFVEGKSKPTANEQNFRWASQAVRWRIGNETLAAAAEGRAPMIFANPFEILVLNNMYRTNAQIERERESNGKRNPLQPSVNLGPFLEAAWSKKTTNNNESGVVYLILMLLWGCRKSEHAECVWGDAISSNERLKTSHIWLRDEGDYGAHVFFYDTKNGLDHRLPLGTMARTLLERHQAALAERTALLGFGAKRKWVFPAKNKYSKTGHYSNPNELLDAIREEAGIAMLTRHDLRRSFGSLMVSIDVPLGIQSRFFNHKSRSEGVTRIYTKAEWALMKEWMNRIEQAIISKAPNIYNSLKPVDWAPLPAPEAHVCTPAKSRTGRPRTVGMGKVAAVN